MIPMRLEISVAQQKLRVVQGRKVLKTCRISTSKFGLGATPGSNKTPVGRLRIAAKFGAGALWGTIFQSRQAIGLWTPAFVTDNDLITSRILWLAGCEPRNATTESRYIYIHGTNQEHLLGQPASHGCIRMANADVIALFDQVDVGVEVHVIDDTTAAKRKRQARAAD
jgi:hypothetical protein